jgi:hypothetical protein
MQTTVSKPDIMETGSKFNRLLSQENMVAVIMFTIMSVSVCLSLYQLATPGASPMEISPESFSSDRAMEHLQRIAQKPHPVGSPEHEAVLNYLRSALASMNLKPEIQETTVLSQRRNFPEVGAMIKNVLVRLPGTNPSRALVFTAHYDSAPTGPGASDDGAAVAALLECLRALRAGALLRNDLIFLFTDAEEIGMLGAKAFADEHPGAKGAGLVFNFEARGNSGPSIMFETSAENGWLIKQFAKAAPHPVANSLTYEIYRLLPNYTDLSIYKEAGISGMNFAYINGLDHYHTRLDTTESVDEGSLQHHGLYMLSLARHFGNLDLNRMKEPDAAYFSIPGSILIHYPAVLGKYLTSVSAVLLIILLIWGISRKRQKGHKGLTISGVTWGWLTLLVNMVLSAMLVTLAWLLISLAHRQFPAIFRSDADQNHLYLACFMSLTLAVNSASYAWVGRKVSLGNLGAGSLLWWLLIAILTALFLPGGNYLFIWPLISGLLTLAFILLSNDQQPISPGRLAVFSISAIPGIILMIPILYLVFLAMTLNASPALAIMLTLLVGLHIPQLRLMAGANHRRLTAGALLISLILMICGVLSSGFDEKRRWPNHVFYALNSDLNKAVWASRDQKPDEWTSQFFVNGSERDSLSEYLGQGRETFLKSPAPPAPLPPPIIKVSSDSASGGVRDLRFQVISPRQAPILIISADPESRVLAYTVNHKQMTNDRDQPWRFRYHGLPKDGVEIALKLTSSAPVKLLVADQSDGLPHEFIPFKPRPDWMMPSIFPNSDTILVSKSFTF